MLDTGSYFTLCSNINECNTYSSVNYLNSGLEREYPASLMSSIVLSKSDDSIELCHIKFVTCLLLILKFLLDARVNELSSSIINTY